MNYPKEKWTVYGKRADFKAIGEHFGIDQVTARIIRNRDIVGDESIDRYLNGTLKDTYDPALMRDMIKGCQLIREKIEQKKKIRIISDYDVDGVVSNYILLKGLGTVGADISYEIPDRMQDGYGINERIIQAAYDDGVDTIITCDNGIAAFPAISLGKQLGMTIVVTDHHDVPYDETDGERTYRLVAADAVIDPKRADCEYPFKYLCGAGVAYKLLRCLYELMDVEWEDEGRFIDVLAVATVCDVVDLIDENRIYVKEGMKLLSSTGNVGLGALLKFNKLYGQPIKAYHLGFVIGPCINAAGRLESAKEGLELLLCENEERAMKLASGLHELNNTRKDMTNRGVEEALSIVESQLYDDKVLVIYMPKLHESLAGIVAGKVRESCYRPVYVITDAEDGCLKGSGRSIEGYNMFEELTKSKELLIRFGGHSLAAGFSLERNRLEDFRRAVNSRHSMTEEVLTPRVRLDVAMPVSYISRELVEELGRLEPFGKGNEKPLFGQSGLRVRSATRMGKEGQFLRLLFADKDGYTMEAVDFNGNKFIECIKKWFSDEECDKMLKGLPNSVILNVAYFPEINSYRDRISLQLHPVAYQKTEE